MARPKNLRYLKTHEWARADGEFAWIGGGAMVLTIARKR